MKLPNRYFPRDLLSTYMFYLLRSSSLLNLFHVSNLNFWFIQIYWAQGRDKERPVWSGRWGFLSGRRRTHRLRVPYWLKILASSLGGFLHAFQQCHFVSGRRRIVLWGESKKLQELLMTAVCNPVLAILLIFGICAEVSRGPRMSGQMPGAKRALRNTSALPHSLATSPQSCAL